MTATCARAVRCRYLPDADTCRASSRLPDWLVGRLAAVRASRAAYHGEQMAACIDRTQGGDCTLTDVLATFAICSGSFEGTLLEGAPCVDAADCRSQRCETTVCEGTCCVGICAPPEADSVPVEPQPGEGDACGASSYCSSPLYCDFGAGICRALPERGDACDPSSGIPCDRLDDGCDATTLTCVPRLDVGQACAPTTNGTPVGCVSFAWCDGTVCRPRSSIGQSCLDAPCLGGLACDPATGACILALPIPSCGQ